MTEKRQTNDIQTNVPKAVIASRLEHLHRACLDAGLRMTTQRLAVFKEIAQTGEHPDADTIYERVKKEIPNISLDTVYRNLTQLEQLGILRRVDPLSGRARFDANGREHHHFVCTVCHDITDIYLSPGESLFVPEQSLRLGEVQSLHLQVRGVCDACKTSTQMEK